jgi:dipeptidyl aminopeptidase/acylaminoacyl peptidase
MHSRRWPRATAAVLAACVAAPAIAQEPYRQPPAPIAQILDAEPTPAVSVSPNNDWLLLLEREGLPPISEVAAAELRLAGIRIDPRTSGGSRGFSFSGLRLRSVDGNTERRIETPDGMRISSPMWSADGTRIAFVQSGEDGQWLWVADVATGQARRVSDRKLNAVLGSPCDWISNTPRLVCTFVPSNRGAEPAAPNTPAGPVVQESRGREAPNRTYQDLLQNSHDAALFKHFATSQLALVSLDGTVTNLGPPAMYGEADPSPNGEFLYVSTVHEPFSYVVTLRDFPTTLAVWDMNGRQVKELAKLPLRDDVPAAFDAVAPGPRSVSWRADAPATLVWVEALDGGNPRTPAEKRDRMLSLAAPFTGQPTPLFDAASRLRGVDWVRADLALVTERWWRTRETKTWMIDPSSPAKAAQLLFSRSYEDRYDDPGSFETKLTPNGTRVVLTTADGRSAYLTGQGASPQGDMPFLDRIDFATKKTTRLWRSAPPRYETVVALLDPQGQRAITRQESVTEPPNYFVRDLRRQRVARLTNFADPAPQFAGIEPKLITYTRNDGVQLSGTMYLPPGYDSTQGPLPFLFWAYPREFKTAAAAAQVQGSEYRFVRPGGSSHLFLLTQGYGILDGPSMPIIGEGDKEPNDTYVEQLVASARAGIDKVVAMGVADRDRIAVGGHSYGAFMAANLLAHSDLFKAGIARSGAYNRTLTPFGFQQEERPYWEAPEIYHRMSPFNYADRIKEPILLIHGQADNNSGTFPVQSDRMYSALMGNGATVRYIELPAESHGYRARESVGHTLWEMVTWLDEHVKGEKTAAVVP